MQIVTLRSIPALLLAALIVAREVIGLTTSGTPVHALFDLAATTTAPLPSDWFTIEDTTHNTGRQVDLPYPNCDERPSDCKDIGVINTLDGFNLQPRLSIPFDGPIDVHSATSQSVFLISLGSALGQAAISAGASSASTRSSGIRRRTRCTSNPTSYWPSTRAMR
jgi:hypothetical protein